MVDHPRAVGRREPSLKPDAAHDTGAARDRRRRRSSLTLLLLPLLRGTLGGAAPGVWPGGSRSGAAAIPAGRGEARRKTSRGGGYYRGQIRECVGRGRGVPTRALKELLAPCFSFGSGRALEPWTAVCGRLFQDPKERFNQNCCWLLLSLHRILLRETTPSILPPSLASCHRIGPDQFGPAYQAARQTAGFSIISRIYLSRTAGNERGGKEGEIGTVFPPCALGSGGGEDDGTRAASPFFRSAKECSFETLLSDRLEIETRG